MEKSKYLAAKAPGAAGAYLGLQQICIRAGDGPFLHATQWVDLQMEGVTIYAVGPVGKAPMRAGAHTKRLSPSTSELRGFVVHPLAREGGRGSELGRYIVGEEFADGVERIILGVRILDGELNQRAARLYERLGFKMTGEVRSMRPKVRDPRSRHLLPTLDPDGRYRMAMFEMLNPVLEVRRHG